jgi:hypothetical protein
VPGPSTSSLDVTAGLRGAIYATITNLIVVLEVHMPIAVTLVLLLFWVVVAYRAFERGDLLLAGVFALVGIVLTVYRYRAATKRAAQTNPNGPSNPVK